MATITAAIRDTMATPTVVAMETDWFSVELSDFSFVFVALMTFCRLKYCEANSSGVGGASSTLSRFGADANDGGLFLYV